MAIATEIYIQFLGHLEFLFTYANILCFLMCKESKFWNCFLSLEMKNVPWSSEWCGFVCAIILLFKFQAHHTPKETQFPPPSNTGAAPRSKRFPETLKNNKNKTPLLLHLLIETNIYSKSFYINTGIIIFLQTILPVFPNRCSNKILKLIGPKLLWVIKGKEKKKN